MNFDLAINSIVMEWYKTNSKNARSLHCHCCFAKAGKDPKILLQRVAITEAKDYI